MRTGSLDLTFNDCEILAYSYYQEGRNTIPESAKKIYTANTLTIVASLLKIFLALSKTMMTIASSITLSRVNLLKENYEYAYDLNMKAYKALEQKNKEINAYLKLANSQMDKLTKKKIELADKEFDIDIQLLKQKRIQKDIAKRQTAREEMTQKLTAEYQDVASKIKSLRLPYILEEQLMLKAFDGFQNKLRNSMESDEDLVRAIRQNLRSIAYLTQEKNKLTSEIQITRNAWYRANQMLNQALDDQWKVIGSLETTYKVCKGIKEELDKENYKFKILDILTTKTYYE